MSSTNHRRPLRVLVDMDGVLCDFEGHFLTVYRSKFPNSPFIPLENRRTFYIKDQYGELEEGLKDMANGVITGEGFFLDLPQVEGAIDAVKEMATIPNVEVFLCTSPMVDAPLSVSEKFKWVREHLGEDWMHRIILTSDKTMVQGDILIDDRPVIKGSFQTPSWDHILFSACHNRVIDITRIRRIASRLDGWTNQEWKQIVHKYKERHCFR